MCHGRLNSFFMLGLHSLGLGMHVSKLGLHVQPQKYINLHPCVSVPHRVSPSSGGGGHIHPSLLVHSRHIPTEDQATTTTRGDRETLPRMAQKGTAALSQRSRTAENGAGLAL